jgi:allantoin racemase
MRLLVINPNTTRAMTDSIGETARRAAREGTEIEAVSPAWGPASIEGHAEEELAAVAALQVVAERAGEFDGVVIACYGDPGLYAARELSPVPVVGIAEASMLTACTLAHKFSVVTVLDRTAPLIADVVRRYGLESRCSSIRTTGLAVLDIERDPAAAERAIVAESRRAIEEDGAEAVCLGCAGMGALDRAVAAALDGVPVVDGVATAVKMVEGLVDLGLGTSRRAAFREPGPKQLSGEEPLLESFRLRLGQPGPVAA